MGVRKRVYEYADTNFGYHLPGGHPFCYYQEQENNLQIAVFFETKDHAMAFQSKIRLEGYTIKSPLNSLVISSRIKEVLDVAVNLEDRIFFDHYKPEDYNSPQQTLSIISAPITIYEATTDVFNYQRIEGDHCFLGLVKTESGHLMSHAHCLKDPTCAKYDKDENNRLALSSNMHDYYDGKNCIEGAPLFNLEIVSVSEFPVLNNRYEIQLQVHLYKPEADKLVIHRLNSATLQENGLYKVSIYVVKPKVFKLCLEWKKKEIEKIWSEVSDMTSSVP
jgi:hypothetical protein